MSLGDVGRHLHTKLSSILVLCLSLCPEGFAQYVTANKPEPTIIDVSAMCSSEGITAAFLFDAPFLGKIYSLDYAMVHDCVYYNGRDSNNILFSIPAHRCGTRLSRTSRNTVDQMENRVYVQMEPDAQTAADRQFLFVCQLSDTKSPDTDIRRHPVVPTSVSSSYPMAPDPVKPPSTPLFRLSTHIQPVSSNVVPRIAALSSDGGHFGNWPIPGARPYSPAVTPVVSWPKIPLPEPIVPRNRPMLHIPSIGLPDPALQDSADVYATSSHLSQTTTATSTSTTTPPNPFLPMGPAITPIRDVPRVIPALEPVRTSNLPTEPILAGSYVTSDSGTRGGAEQVVIGRMAPSRQTDATKIPAYPWNKPYPGQVNVDAFNTNQTITVTSEAGHVRNWDKAKIFKEEEPKIGVEFRKDGDDKATSSDNVPVSPLVSNQEYFAPPAELTLEIQQGRGPFAPAVNSPIKIGDNITLVVRAKSQMKGENEFDMFVHSCFAADGPGNTKIDLIDRNGCVLRSQFVSPLNRTKDPDSLMYYYFGITAFKFPGPDDVYFSCSVELTPFRNSQEICPAVRRSKRESPSGKELRLFDSVEVELPQRMDSKHGHERSGEEPDDVCLSKPLAVFVFILFDVLLVAVVVLAYLSMSFYIRLSSHQPKTIYSMY
ncbi:hypothetical protein Q1695_016353 [Nippostrongylus brasiliensis]|nr:hypothetical protein Q1695_016353 [Nippostrongylus brasiliensis]